MPMRFAATALRLTFALSIVPSLLLLPACSSSKPKDDINYIDEICAKPPKNGPRLPAVSAVAPAQGSEPGGTRVQVEGDGFKEGAVVLLGKYNCIGVSVSDTNHLSCVTPPYTGKQVGTELDVLVVNPDQQCGILAKAFTYVPNVTISPGIQILAVKNHATFTGSGGTLPYSFSLVAGGGSVDAKSGVYTAPDQSGSAAVRITDASGTTSEALVLINSALTALPAKKTIAVDNQYLIAGSGGVPSLGYTVESGGGSVDSTNGLFTAPGEAGNSIIKITDVMGNEAKMTVEVMPKLQIDPSTRTIAPGNHIDFKTTGGVPPYVYSLQSGVGTIDSGTGAYVAASDAGTAWVQAADSYGNFSRAIITITPPLIIYPTVKKMILGDSLKFVAAGGVPPYQYSVISGKGKIDGESGLYTAPQTASEETVQVKDSAGNTADAKITVSADGFVSGKLVAGYAHTCALIDGAVKCWGDNHFGQLGNQTKTSSNRPVAVDGLDQGVLELTAGQNHTCALLNGGEVRCWGDNRYGQLGDRSTIDGLTPRAVFGLGRGVQSISAGQYHTCAVISGAVLCWGSNRRGQLGNGTTIQSLLPVQVKTLTQGVIAVAAGAAHTCAIVADGVRCWGYNYAGQLGDGTISDRHIPVPVKSIESTPISISAGGYHTCVAMSDGVLCWGYNGSGQLGDRTRTNRLVPVPTQGLGEAIGKMSSGLYHTCVTLPSGGAKCWGYNATGQLGDGTRDNHSFAVPVHGLTGAVESVGTGYNHSCALVDGHVRCWGENNLGQFGDHSTTSSLVPARAAL